MIRFDTAYARYEVTVQDSKFHVKKYEALSEHDRSGMVVGQTRVSSKLRLELGDYASFDSFSTDEVVSIKEVG